MKIRIDRTRMAMPGRVLRVRRDSAGDGGSLDEPVRRNHDLERWRVAAE